MPVNCGPVDIVLRSAAECKRELDPAGWGRPFSDRPVHDSDGIRAGGDIF